MVHKDDSTWLAYYKDTINGEFKYIFLSAGSSLKGQSDREKFEKARSLKVTCRVKLSMQHMQHRGKGDSLAPTTPANVQRATHEWSTHPLIALSAL